MAQIEEHQNHEVAVELCAANCDERVGVCLLCLLCFLFPFPSAHAMCHAPAMRPTHQFSLWKKTTVLPFEVDWNFLSTRGTLIFYSIIIGWFLLPVIEGKGWSGDAYWSALQTGSQDSQCKCQCIFTFLVNALIFCLNSIGGAFWNFNTLNWLIYLS